MPHTALTLPCLRGTFGDWVYYASLLPMREVVNRVSYADEIHQSKELSQYIQRSLTGERAVRIADYLIKNEQRFFNSLVLATYAGSPDWYEVGNLSGSKNNDILGNVPPEAMEVFGLLAMSGKEKIFAMDGQHRLAGMRRAIETENSLGDELVPLILIAHSKTAAGLRRSRRLFTTLNKTAVPVKKDDIIALDEDDVMAIITRRLVESDKRFKHPRIAVIAGEALPSTNVDALMTIAGLYDILKLLFKFRDDTVSDYTLRFNRPSDRELDEYHAYAISFFEALAESFPEIKKFFSASDPRTVVARNRRSNGGHLLFRTIGMDILVRTAISYAKDNGVDLSEAIKALRIIPTRLTAEPFKDTIWDSAARKMVPPNKTLARNLLMNMLGMRITPKAKKELLGKYRSALGVDARDTSVQLPAKIV